MPAKSASSRNSHLRLRIAQVAAQLMAEHGIRDYAFAKRKAARQLGVTDTHALPGNEEIDEALRSYHALYSPDEHAETLRAQREQALAVLEAFGQFSPMLTGAVLSGTASDHTHIEIELYADASKEFEQFLINEGASFKVADRHGRYGYLIYSDPADIMVTVLPLNSQHANSRGRADGVRRMNAEQLTRLLQEQD
ncbi:MAG: nucleotidyltransferase [Hydrogenophilaceae bacterium]|nr:nucleotidyltransferase [Hydrogenophilaceae bacterium]